MLNWFKSKYRHVVYWGVLLVYLLAANPVYTHFIVRNGKPESSAPSLPADDNRITYNLVEMRPVVIQGQSLYELQGFAFVRSDPTRANKITVVLQQGSRRIAFSTTPDPFPDMIESYPEFTPGMEQAEFDMLIANNVLQPGVYQIGVLLEDAAGTDRAYVLTKGSIKQTPNTLSFTPGQ